MSARLAPSKWFFKINRLKVVPELKSSSESFPNLHSGTQSCPSGNFWTAGATGKFSWQRWDVISVKRRHFYEFHVSPTLPAKLSGCASCPEIAGRTTLNPGVQGGRIYTTIPRSLAKKYISIIHEFHMYTMSNFIIVDNITKKKNGVSRNLAEMHTVEKVEDLELFDIIGEVVGKEDPRELITSKGIETKRLVVIVEDLEKNRLSCTLFGETVDQILPHLDDDQLEPLIVILQYFKATRWNGKTLVQSHFELSKVHVNPELKEVMSFKKSLLSGSESTSMRISHQSTQSSWVGTDELNNGTAIVKTIEEVFKSVEVETPIGNRYECAKCGHTHGCAALRYKVEVMVFDGTGSITLLLWDRETNQLCGKAAEKIVEEDDAKEDEYPKSLDNMMDRIVLFKINVKSGNIKHYDQIYTVMKVCDDEETVAKNKPKQMDENRGSNTLEMSGHVVNLKNDNDPQLTVDSMENCVESLKYKIPAKRIADSLKYGSVVDEEC
ncbi:replication protein A 70 kDa DNA-binding subunit A-like isoform [Arachis hypogaea]|nr:replication protein A 70 kDa DNA-binding subunit A-like isoform [Arachis hypogaea]